MNESDLQQFVVMIQARLNALADEDALGEEGQKTVELDQQAIGRLSRMDALQNQAMAKATDARRSMERAQLQAALARIDDGEFGYCEDCGDEIATGRLKLNPAATKCIECANG